METGKKIKTFNENTKEESEDKWIYNHSVAFSPDGRHVISGFRNHDNHFIKLWDITTGKKIKEFKGHLLERIISVAFSPDGRYITSGNGDKTIRLWDVLTGKEIRVFQVHSEVNSVAFSPDGKYILSGCDDRTLRLWDVANSDEIKAFIGYSGRVSSVAFSPNGQLVLSGCDDKTLNLWDFSSGKKIKTFQEESYIHSVTFSGDERYAISGTNKTIRLWNLGNGKDIKTFQGGDDVTFSPDGRYALSKDGFTLKLRDLTSGNEIRRDFSKDILIRSLALSSDSQFALLTTIGDKLILWDVENGKQIQTFGLNLNIKDEDKYSYLPRHLSIWGSSVTFSPDGQYALLAGYAAIRFCNVASGREIRTLQGHSQAVLSVSFSHDGQYALSGSEDRTMRLWDVASGRNNRVFQGHLDAINSVAFSPDRRYALSGSYDGTIRFWNTATSKEIAQMVSFTDGEWLAITPEGYYNASVHGDKYLNVRIGNNVYGIDQYKAKYYRPDIVQLALKLGDTQQAIAQLRGDTEGLKASEQPPKVWFVSPSDRYETDKPFIEIQVKTEDIADTAESVTFKVNQRILATEKKPVRPVSEGAKVREFSRQVPLIPGENFIEAEARGKAGATQKAMILVIRKGGEKKLPALWYFGAGVSQHSISSLSLKYSAKDVTGLADALKRQKGRAYSEVNIRTLTDAEATRGNIMDSIESFFAGTKQEDVAILFVSGHGMNSASGYHFIAHDTNPDRMSSTGISWEFFNNVLKTVKSSVLLFADTCHSGNITGNENWKNQANADTNEFLRGAADNGVIVFASSSGTSVSREDPSWGHGAFAKALIDGILGEAAYRENVVKLSFLQDYVKSSVMKLTENTQQPVIPKLAGGGEFLDLVLAKKM